MITVSTLSALGVGLLGPIYPIFILNRFSASIVDIGLLIAVFTIVAAMFKAPAGRLVDLYGKEKVLLAGIILGSLCSIFYVFAFDLMHLYPIEFLFGISYGLRDPSLLSLVVDMSSGDKRGLFLGLFSSAYDIAYAFATFVSTLIVTYFGFETLFLACSGLQAMTGFFVLKSGRSKSAT